MPSQRFVVNVEAAVLNEGRYIMVIRSEKEEHAGGTLGFPGGRVEGHGASRNVLEATARREVLEETGISIGDMHYVESHLFNSDAGEDVVDVVFLCRYTGGKARPENVREVESVKWMTPQEIFGYTKTPAWTRRSVERAESAREKLGW